MTMVTDRIRDGFFRHHRLAAPRQSLWAAADAAAGNIATMLLAWHDRASRRRQLLALSDRALHDFGSNRAAAESEGDKPFWRP